MLLHRALHQVKGSSWTPFSVAKALGRHVNDEQRHITLAACIVCGWSVPEEV